jgi:hypothetical protein
MAETVLIGSTCRVERRSWGGSLDAAYDARVVRVTAKRAYLNGRDFFALTDPRRVLHPKYLDTESRVISVTRECPMPPPPAPPPDH